LERTQEQVGYPLISNRSAYPSIPLSDQVYHWGGRLDKNQNFEDALQELCFGLRLPKSWSNALVTDV
jgi:hypothetical protein